jgi:hypothetical protein
VAVAAAASGSLPLEEGAAREPESKSSENISTHANIIVRNITTLVNFTKVDQHLRAGNHGSDVTWPVFEKVLERVTGSKEQPSRL